MTTGASSYLFAKFPTGWRISIPGAVRRRLGVGPGSVIEWDEEDEKLVVRRSARYSSEDIYRALFPNGRPQRRRLQELDTGIARHAKKRHARR